MSQLKLGFVGLGIMGAPMAGHLVAAGHTVYVNTRSKVPEAIAKSAAIQCASPAEVAEKADIIFTMVPFIAFAVLRLVGARREKQASPNGNGHC